MVGKMAVRILALWKSKGVPREGTLNLRIELSRFPLGCTGEKFNLGHNVQALHGCYLTWVWHQVHSGHRLSSSI